MAVKKILVLSYWPLHDVLTQAAILPHVKLLQQVKGIAEIILVTIERAEIGSTNRSGLEGFKGVKHYGLRSKNYTYSLLNKINDFLTFPENLTQIVKTERVDALLASGTLAGALAYKVWQKSKVPFYVLYEPHAAYMLDDKVWHKYDPRYIFQSKWEEEQLQVANGLLVVSENYRQHLLANYPHVDAAKVLLGRNPVDSSLFQFSEEDRRQVRDMLKIPSEYTIGIYVGKYGGLYYNNEAFQIYRTCFEQIPNFRLIILSPQPEMEILGQFRKYNIDCSKVYITRAKHSEVPNYLSAADFAFATYKPGPSKKYLSPVKIGEYWANGLPVMLTEGVGDDSDIIKREGGGALFNLQQKGSIDQAIQQIQIIIKDPTHRQEIPKLAAKYRSPEKIREAYEYFFNQHEAQ